MRLFGECMHHIAEGQPVVLAQGRLGRDQRRIIGITNQTGVNTAAKLQVAQRISRVPMQPELGSLPMGVCVQQRGKALHPEQHEQDQQVVAGCSHEFIVVKVGRVVSIKTGFANLRQYLVSLK